MRFIMKIDDNPQVYKAYKFVSDLESKVFDLGDPYQKRWDTRIRWIYEDANCDGWQEVATKRPDIMLDAYIEAMQFTIDNKL